MRMVTTTNGILFRYCALMFFESVHQDKSEAILTHTHYRDRFLLAKEDALQNTGCLLPGDTSCLHRSNNQAPNNQGIGCD